MAKKTKVADRINQATAHCRTFAPGLVLARATLLPFEDVLCGEEAGPQPEAEDYDPDEEPWFSVEIDDPANRGGDTWARVTARGVRISWDVPNGSGGLIHGGDIRTDLPGLWDYLRQIPRSAGAFFSR